MRLHAFVFVAVEGLNHDGPEVELVLEVDAALGADRVVGTARRYGEGTAAVPIDVDAGAVRAILGPLGLDLSEPADEVRP